MEYLYVLKNSFMQDVVKIGFTTRNPHIRAAELGNVTGVPGKFEIIHIFPVINGRKAESLVFSSLSNNRLDNKEFFKLSEDQAFHQIEKVLKSNGLIHSGTDNGIHDFVKHLIKLSDPNLFNNHNDILSANRVANFVNLFLKLLKTNDDIKIIDYYREHMKGINGVIENSHISESDLKLMYDLFLSGYAYYIEKTIHKDGFSLTNQEIIRAASNVVAIFNNRKSFKNHEFTTYFCKSITTQRDLASTYINELREFQKKNNIDWIPLSIDHPTVNFNNVLKSPEVNYHPLKLFGFKHFSLNGKLSEGEVNIIAPHKGTAAIFNGQSYSYETVTGLSFTQDKKVDLQNWIYNWANSKESRIIFIVIKDGKVAHVGARESLIGNSKGIIKVAFVP